VSVLLILNFKGFVVFDLLELVVPLDGVVATVDQLLVGKAGELNLFPHCFVRVLLHQKNLERVIKLLRAVSCRFKVNREREVNRSEEADRWNIDF
jgi:hypothetical protein